VSLNRSALRVLVADGDAAIRDATREALEWDGCEVSVASTTEQVLELVRALRHDLIVIGETLASEIGGALRVGLGAEVPVIALSAGGDVPVADALLDDPVDALELIATVRLLTET
jgi:DNA-binding response OmpR family regulator